MGSVRKRTEYWRLLGDKEGLKNHSLKFWLLVALSPLLAGFALVSAVFVYSSLFGWNWARAPLERTVLSQTGRPMVIAGDLAVNWGWPTLAVTAQDLSFANPPWATQPQMLEADSAQFSVDLPALLHRRLVFPTVALSRPRVVLEYSSDGRKSWLLDKRQEDESAVVEVGSLTLDDGRLEYVDVAAKTHVRLHLTTHDTATGTVAFAAEGSYKSQPVLLKGQGASVLALRDEHTPYALKAEGTVGPTYLKIGGTVTGLASLSAVDLQLELRGGSLAQLFPLLGVGLPKTRAFAMQGHLLHSARIWRYENLKGKVGQSDLAGTLQVALGGVRPMLTGDVVSKVLNLDDLSPAVGLREGPKVEARTGAPKVLPDLPFESDRWKLFDADVGLEAASILRSKALPLDQLVMRIKMQEAVLTLEPLDFAAAGGHLTGSVQLDARQSPIQAHAKILMRKLLLNKAFPTLALTKASVGQANGSFELQGQGNSVGRMLATANGHFRLVVEEGEISRLLMEQMGLHLPEIVLLNLAGDRNVELRCAAADFDVKQGMMTAKTLVLDTAVNTLNGSGQIDLAQEKLDLTLEPRTRTTSLVALRSPIHVTGTLGAPAVSLDKSRILARSAGAIVLGLVNPFLALLPLVDRGPGETSPCATLFTQH